MKEVKIYALSSSKKPNDFRYIGKTTEKLQIRLRRHISSSKKEKTHKAKWILKELKQNNEILITEIFKVLKEEDWGKWEKYFISQYTKKGYKLTNLTIGGENLSGEYNPFFGKKHSKKTIDKIKLNMPTSKEVYMYDLQGNLIKKYNSINDASTENNISVSEISDVCNKRKKHKTAHGYVWRFKNEPFSLEYISPAEHLRKEICQYDKNGILIQEHESISKASEKTKISTGNISRCCNKKIKSVGGYVWRFNGDKFFFSKERTDSKKIIQLNMNGAYIAEHTSIYQASKNTGINQSGIYLCCNGKYKHSGGFKWKFA